MYAINITSQESFKDYLTNLANVDVLRIFLIGKSGRNVDNNKTQWSEWIIQ